MKTLGNVDLEAIVLEAGETLLLRTALPIPEEVAELIGRKLQALGLTAVLLDRTFDVLDPSKTVLVPCQSCGGDFWTEGARGIEGARCHGCGMVLCQSCTDVFGHLADGEHGAGDPAARVAELLSLVDRALEAVPESYQELREDLGRGLRGVKPPAPPLSRVRELEEEVRALRESLAAAEAAAHPTPAPSAPFRDIWQHDETGRIVELPIGSPPPGPRYALVATTNAPHPTPPPGEVERAREAFTVAALEANALGGEGARRLEYAAYERFRAAEAAAKGGGE